MKDSPRSKAADANREVNKQLIVRALTEPRFRKLLVTDPAKALDVSRISAQNEQEIGFVLAAVEGIEYQISALADKLLCLDGPCGIA